MINMSEEQYKQALAKAYDDGAKSQASFPAHMVGPEYARDIRKRRLESLFKDTTMTEEEKNRSPTLDELIERNLMMIESDSIRLPGEPAWMEESRARRIQVSRDAIKNFEKMKEQIAEIAARKAAREAGL